jgi:hypothetical protein
MIFVNNDAWFKFNDLNWSFFNFKVNFFLILISENIEH